MLNVTLNSFKKIISFNVVKVTQLSTGLHRYPVIDYFPIMVHPVM